LKLRSFLRAEITREDRERVRRIRPMIEVLEDRITPAPIPPVTVAMDDGTGKAGTLSAAIMAANLAPNSTITFNIPNTSTITVTGDLPTITVPVTINGYSQGGQNATPGVPYVQLQGPGAQGPLFDGLTVTSGGVVIQGLAIGGFNGNGIVLNDPNPTSNIGDTVQGCAVGTDLSLEAPDPNTRDGILIQGAYNTIGGTATGTGNVISGNGTNGIEMEKSGAQYNDVFRNVIGLDVLQSFAIPNAANGVWIDGGASNNFVGFTPMGGTGLGNVISGNTAAGVRISGSNNNNVEGNSIGVAVNGYQPFANSVGVILDSGASGNAIGSAVLGGGNIISGNTEEGVVIASRPNDAVDGIPMPNSNIVDGNYIGTDSTGSTAVPNGSGGVLIVAATNTRIYDNLISGNSGNGLEIDGYTLSGTVVATKTTVTGNLIGTNAAGTAAISNGWNGMFIYLADQNTIGGATYPQTGVQPSNVISGNKKFGIEIGSSANLVENNYIGTDISGTQNLGNLAGGINIGYNQNLLLANGPPQNVIATNNTIGGTGGLNSTLNVISGNQGGNADSGNGIELNGVGVQGTLIEGNYIGTDVYGLNPLGNNNGGIYVAAHGGAPTNTTIGVAGVNGGNVISANLEKNGIAGLDAETGTTGTYQNNMIGYNLNGQDPNGDLKNVPDEVSFPANGWTDAGGNKEQ
jgi:hypothetical protein